MAEFHYTGKKPTKRRIKITEASKLSLPEYMEMFVVARISGQSEQEKRASAGLAKYGIKCSSFTKTREYLNRALEYYLDNPCYIGTRKFINDSKIAMSFGTEFRGSIFDSDK